MLTHFINHEDHIIEITVSGKISKEELGNTIAEIAKPLNDWADIRVLKRIDSFSGMDLQAWIDDFKFAFENLANLKKIKKVAIVTDKDWIEDLASLLKPLFSYEIEVFESDDIEKARLWLK